ncbi:hypothetical protein [Microbacterium hydrocarbonoxydans]|uniref:hypothetical protein n=1 Tax=Microbacterium hydrocarbonoxydans TaxID=273678 RepID=UPI002041EFA6|nr:hypothetical protein [Microbacterium hydrocarbonoxydans]MCM3780884.1 hypothetical protein [Microbacterium hydrocarbonoxydans]
MSDPYQQNPQAPRPGAQPPGQPHGYPPESHRYPPYQGQQHQGQLYQSQGYPTAASAPRTMAGALGRIAFIVALVALGIRLFSTLLSPFLYTGDYYSVWMGLTSVIGFIVFLADAGALAVGIVALRRSGPYLQAAIAVGLAGASFVGYLATGLSGVFSWLAY